MKLKKYSVFYIVCVIFVIASCSPKRNLVYFSDVEQSAPFEMAISNAHLPKVQAGDIISITVSTLDPASNALFNTGTLSNTNQLAFDNAAGSVNLGKDGYLVGNDGAINFPILGKVELKGLSLEGARGKLQTEIVKFVKDPIVNVRFLNFKVTVVGEVNKPGSFTVENERMNILDAIGLAGDMTGFGRRENVLVIREIEGRRRMARLNLNSSVAFDSPFFYLQQNDLVYVEPHSMKEKQVSRNPNTVSIILGALSLATIVVSQFVR